MFNQEPSPNEKHSEVVSNVEKISVIVAPYFIAMVGLFLYDNNILLGTSLILIGILSLLKISIQELGQYCQELKKYLIQIPLSISRLESINVRR